MNLLMIQREQVDENEQVFESKNGMIERTIRSIDESLISDFMLYIAHRLAQSSIHLFIHSNTLSNFHSFIYLSINRYMHLIAHSVKAFNH